MVQCQRVLVAVYDEQNTGGERNDCWIEHLRIEHDTVDAGYIPTIRINNGPPHACRRKAVDGGLQWQGKPAPQPKGAEHTDNKLGATGRIAKNRVCGRIQLKIPPDGERRFGFDDLAETTPDKEKPSCDAQHEKDNSLGRGRCDKSVECHLWLLARGVVRKLLSITTWAPMVTDRRTTSVKTPRQNALHFARSIDQNTRCATRRNPSRRAVVVYIPSDALYSATWLSRPIWSVIFSQAAAIASAVSWADPYWPAKPLANSSSATE